MENLLDRNIIIAKFVSKVLQVSLVLRFAATIIIHLIFCDFLRQLLNLWMRFVFMFSVRVCMYINKIKLLIIIYNFINSSNFVLLY